MWCNTIIENKEDICILHQRCCPAEPDEEMCKSRHDQTSTGHLSLTTRQFTLAYLYTLDTVTAYPPPPSLSIKAFLFTSGMLLRVSFSLIYNTNLFICGASLVKDPTQHWSDQSDIFCKISADHIVNWHVLT